MNTSKRTRDGQTSTLHASPGSLSGRLRDERGIALMSVLGVLAIMLVLASLMATSSQTEAKLSGLTNQSARAFAAADAGLEFALGDVNNWTQLATRCTDLKTAGLAMDGNVCVTFSRQSAPPVAVKVSALKFSAFVFDVTSVGTALPSGSSRVAMEAARLGPAQMSTGDTRVHTRFVAAATAALSLVVATAAFAGSDLDVFTAGAAVQPNVLFLFDNSGSMKDPIPYQPATTYPGVAPAYTPATKYSRCTAWDASCFCTASNAVPPTSNWKTAAVEGANGFLNKCGFVDGNNDGQDDRYLNEFYVKSGNRLNYEAAPGASKMSIAQTAVDGLLTDPGNDNIRMGLMILNGTVVPDVSTCTASTTAYHNDTSI